MFFSDDELDLVRRFYTEDVAAAATPLRRMPSLARRLGLGGLLLKDESDRFGLPAFKILGVRYAVACLAGAGGTGDLACATAGNHGRAVARAARLAGRSAHVYLPHGTARARVAAIRDEGASVVETDADYDDCVRLMAHEADRRGWTIISDVAWSGYDAIPRLIMAGYTWMLEEAAAAWGDEPPELVVVQAGVGSFAGAVAGWLEARARWAERPRLLVVEPHGSASVAAALRAGKPVSLPRAEPTTMAGLRCAAISPLAWPVLRDCVTATVQISDADAEAAVRMLARPADTDPVVAAGESGAAGLAGLTRLLANENLRPVLERLGVTRDTRVLVFNTEGPTDR